MPVSSRDTIHNSLVPAGVPMLELRGLNIEALGRRSRPVVGLNQPEALSFIFALERLAMENGNPLRQSGQVLSLPGMFQGDKQMVSGSLI